MVKSSVPSARGILSKIIHVSRVVKKLRRCRSFFLDNYLPYTYNSNSVVYVGTHDNNTVLGWIDELDEDTLEFCKKYIDSEDDIVWKLIKTAMASVSDTAIIQMQDYLELGSEARMNTPSVLGGNWQWRMGKNDLTDKLAKKIADITCTYGRYERQ